VDNAVGNLLKDLEKFKVVKVLWKESATTKMQEITECMLLKTLCEHEGVARVFLLETEVGKGHELVTMIADATRQRPHLTNLFPSKAKV